MHGIPSFQMISMHSFPGHLGLSLPRLLESTSKWSCDAAATCFSKRPFGVSTSPKRAHSSCRPVASGNTQMHTSTTGRSARPRWIRGKAPAPTRDDCAAVAHSDDQQHTCSVLQRSDSFIACRVRLMWRLLAGGRGRVVLHPGSGMRKASHERFFPLTPTELHGS